MINLEQVIYLLITVFIPLKATYSTVRHNSAQDRKLWAMYWALYFGFKSLQWTFWLFQYRPFDFIFVLFAIWLYNDSYKGGLFLADFINGTIAKIPAVANIINMISEKVSFVPLFEKSPVYGETVVKPKSQ